MEIRRLAANNGLGKPNVTPEKSGVHNNITWIPVYTGMTVAVSLGGMVISRLQRFPRLLAAFLATLLWLLFGGIASAAGNAQSGSDPESNLPFLFAIYTITWLAFFAYAFYMTRRQSELNREIQELRRMLEQREQSDA